MWNEDPEHIPVREPLPLHFTVKKHLQSRDGRVTTVITRGNVLLQRKNGRWGAAISGEWWLTEHGAEYADQDVGDVGHAAIAVGNLWSAEDSIWRARQLAQEAQDSGDEEKAEEYTDLASEMEENLSDEFGSASVFFNVDVPDEVGIAGVSDPEIWHELQKDPRSCYAKRAQAVAVIGTNFFAWRVTDQSLRWMQDFLQEQILEDDIEEDFNVVIEQQDPHEWVTRLASEVIGFRRAADVWR
jgi:hypothetical protein